MKSKTLLFLSVIFTALFISPTSAWATKASLSCSPASGTYNVGDTFNVNYILDTRTFQAFGSDLFITYDAGMLEVVGTQSTVSSTDTKWTAPVTNSIDASLGKIHLDYGNTQAAYTGTSTIGSISFKAKQAGQAEFKYTFFQQYDDTTPGVAKVWGKKDGTNLSNILTDVTNCIYVISVSVANTPVPTSVPSTPVPVVSELPRSGSMETTIALLVFAFSVLGLGLAIPALNLKNN